MISEMLSYDFIQRADNTVKFVTPENNVWVTD